MWKPEFQFLSPLGFTNPDLESRRIVWGENFQKRKIVEVHKSRFGKCVLFVHKKSLRTSNHTFVNFRMDQTKLGYNPHTNYLRALEKKSNDSQNPKRAWDSGDTEITRVPYFWNCPWQLLPSRILKFHFLGEVPDNKDALYINTLAQGLLWYLLFTSGNSSLLKAVAGISVFEFAVHQQQ